MTQSRTSSGARGLERLRRRAAATPGWLAEVVCPAPAPPPWVMMARVALAICGAPGRSPLRRQTCRSFSDLRTEFQRSMAEPAAVSSRTAGSWPALIALEQVMDTVTATAVHANLAGRRPAGHDVAQVAAALRRLAAAVPTGQPPCTGPLPGSSDLRPVTDAIGAVQRALAGQPGA